MRLTMSLFSALLFFIPLTRSARAQDVREAYEPRVYADASGMKLPYRLLRPVNYDAAKKYPLVIVYHGAGERGDDNAAQLTHCADAFLRPENRSKYPCFVIFPQCPKNQKWVNMPWDKTVGTQPKEPSDWMRMSIEVIGEMRKQFNIDEKRIYVSGLSMGGYGTWDAITRYPNLFAAAVPICGGGDETAAPKAVKVPVWAFHSTDDKAVPVARTQNMIKALRDAGGNPKYTEYTNKGHASWTPAYKDPELFPWLFAQVKP